METLVVKAIYIAFGCVIIVMGGYAVLFPDNTKLFWKDQFPDKQSKDNVEKSYFGVWMAGLGFVVFGAGLILKALTAP